MEIIKVGISISDELFAAALVRGLSRECRNMTFLLDQPEEGDLIITDRPYPEEQQEDRYVYLVHDPEDVGERADLVFCYEDCRVMVNRLTYYNYLLTGRNLEYRGTSAFRTVSFVSAGGGAGVTSLCISVGRMLSILYGCHCLYLALTPLDGARRFMGWLNGADLQKLFYQLKEGRSVPLGVHISSDGYLDRLRAPLINHYMTEIDGELLASLMAAIDKMGRYDLVLVDIGTMYAGGALDLLRNSDRIVFVTDDRQSDRRILRDEIVERLGLAGIGGIHVRNMARERGEADEEMTVSLCRQAFREGDGITTIDLNTTYGADVSVLCEKIMGGNDS